MDREAVERAKQHFGALVEEQLTRVDRMKADNGWADYSSLRPLVIGVCGGDGIGPYISRESQRVLEYILAPEVERGDIVFKTIDGLTIENRAAQLKAIPDDVLDELKQCHVILKAPTTTPRAGDPWPNIESANVAMRRALDLFANVRPVKIPAQGIDWTFFRENTEGAYVMGSRGIHVTEDLAFDFTAVTSQGSERIIEMAFDYARKHDKKRVTVVTKANVIKTTDGKFLETARSIAANYPEIEWDDWYIDIIPAKLVDPKRRSHFRVVVLPNLYGDILTDEAAELQGGVGTAGSANIGRHYAMFEAIHGSAPRMVEEGRVEYADPSGLIRAGAMLLNHIGYADRGRRLEMALEICDTFEKKMVVTGRPTGVKGSEFTDYLLATLKDPRLEERWRDYQATQPAPS
ncbi:MAG: isocitrate/isopropylmalate family dehydrogenase [Dehalococcoidia bacterium]|jgi:isocitrate dehydrogenase (NAD+)